MTDLTRRFAFLNEADRLKSVNRANVLLDLSRPENSAEHSWHAALFALVLGASDRVIAMLLLHDLVEIDCGDHPIHLSHDWAAVQAAEDAAARRLFAMLPGGAEHLVLWQEFEAGDSPDARMARRMDHIQPLFQVLSAPVPLPEHLAIARDNMGRGRAARLADEWPEAMLAAQAMLAGQAPQGAFAQRLAFLAEADRLKSVYRANRLCDGSRHENSAEHSWHLALYALVLAPHRGPQVDIGRVIRMLLIHDLVEIDCGDVPLHSAGGQAHGSADVQAAEAVAARRIFGLLPPAQADGLVALWQEFEAAATPDARFAKALDRCQPVLQNLATGGVGWVEYQVTYAQIEQRVGRWIQRGAPDLWVFLQARLRAHFA